MASLIHILLFITIISFFVAGSSAATRRPNPNSFVFGIRKDGATNQYYTSIVAGTNPPSNLDLVLDLAAPFPWYDCASGYNSSSYRPIPCGSAKCTLSKSSSCMSCNGQYRPGCSNNTCGTTVAGPFSDNLVAEFLGEDVMAVPSGRFGSALIMPRLLFSTAGPESLTGLIKTAEGVLGLAKTEVSLTSQLATEYKIQRKFSLCLPSKAEHGRLRIRDTARDGLRPVVSTTVPLVTNPVSTAKFSTVGDTSDEYFINVSDIKVDGKIPSFSKSSLSIDKSGNGGTKLSLIDPYTVMKTSIHKALIKSFTKKAKDMKIKTAAAVKPFSACFDSKTVGTDETGPKVPTIDLVLAHGKMWRIYGANSMVNVNKNVMCLGFVDGGKKPRTSIVIGGFQLEDNLVEFDLQSSQFGFSSSLFVHNSSCSLYT